MKFRYYFAMAAAALVMTNCSNEEDALQTINDSKSFTATIEGASRSAVDSETGAFSWTDGDKISVWTEDGFDTYVNSSADVNTFAFAAQDENDTQGTAKDYAIYPAGNHEISGSEITINLPAEYAYGSTNMPMLATVENGNSNLSFKHLAGVMRFVVKNVPVGATKFIFTTTNDILTGDYEVSEGEIKKNEEQVNNNNSVTITFSELGAAQDMTFYVPMPVGTYGEYKVQIENAANNLGLTHTSEGVTNTIGRRTLLLMPEFTVDNDGLKKGAGSTIEVTQSEAEISGNQSVTINTTGVSDASATLALNYTPQEGNATLNLSDGSSETTSQESIAKVQINPQGTTPVESLTINTPTLTVELGAGTYGAVEALTATQTLVIGEGVTIETLILNGGALEVADDATNCSISNIIVKDELGLNSAVALGGNIKLLNDIDLNLTSSTALTIESGKTVSIDLNNNKLTTSQSVGTADDIIVQGKLNILNGTIETSNTAFFVKDGGELKLDKCEIISNAPTAVAMSVKDNSKLEATDCTVTTKGSSFRVRGGSTMVLTNCNTSRSEDGTGKTPLVLAEGQSTILTISGGSYTSKEYEEVHDAYAIGVTSGANATINTTVNGGNGGVTVIGASTANLTGGSYSGVKACGLYIDGGSTVKYSNCTFSGVEGDVIVGNQNGGGTVNGTNYTEYAKFEQASTSDEVQSILSNGGNVTLASAIELTTATTVAANKEVTIDLNGYKLTTSQSVGTADDIIVQGKLNILNGTIETSNTAFFVKDGGELKLDKCEIISNAPTAVAMSVKDNSKLEATDCTVTTKGSSFRVRGGSAMVLTNCNTSRSEDGTGKTPLVLAEDQNTILTISGGSYTSKEYEDVYDAYAIGVTKGANATINTTVSGGNGGVTVIGASTANLTGGSYSGVKACGLYIDGGSTVKYSNCTFSGVEGAVVVGNQNGGGTVNDTKYTVHTKIQ